MVTVADGAGAVREEREAPVNGREVSGRETLTKAIVKVLGGEYGDVGEKMGRGSDGVFGGKSELMLWQVGGCNRIFSG